MAEMVYVLCALASIACAALLLRGYRENRSKLLFWSSLCFAGLAVNNVILAVDMLVVPAIDLSLLRTVPAFVAMIVLVAGLVWESR